VYDRLLAAFGPQHWWPGESPLEVMVGAVLVQNTSWRNVERAIANLRDADLMEPRTLYSLAESELAELIRPAGYFQVKARRLHNLLRLVVDEYDGSLEAMFRTDVSTLRNELLGVSGIGPETADAILLYAAGRPVFVADAYARRVLVRHRLLPRAAGYEQARAFLEAHLPSDPALFNEFHALLVAAAKSHCRTAPRCQTCPLRFDLRVSLRKSNRLTPPPRAAGSRGGRRRPGSPARGRARPSP
jgi:endonuclease-3 related protein